MQKVNDAGQAAPLVLELVSGTATLHGEEIELPLRAVKLLAALARRVGEPVAAAELLEAVWAEDAEWTSKQDLHVLVCKLRRLIDGPTKFGKHIRNRRGFGYMLDLDPGQVVIVESPSDEEAADRIVYLGDGEIPPAAEASVTDEVQPQDETVEAEPTEITHEEAALPTAARRSRRVAGAAALVLVLLAGTWSAGYVLSARNASRSETKQPEDDAAEPQQEVGGPSQSARQANNSRRQDARVDKRRRDGKRGSRNNGPVVIAAPGASTGNLTNSSEVQDSSQGSRKDSNKDQPPAPALPPAPTRYLYHLVNPGTGDHFVTTDSATASEQEARGYEGGAIGRIYTSREDNTKAITTNHGTGYIFMGSAPKTEPASRTIALWYSTNDAGDFFYTTKESEAKEDGWTGTRIGYVRAL